MIIYNFRKENNSREHVLAAIFRGVLRMTTHLAYVIVPQPQNGCVVVKLCA